MSVSIDELLSKVKKLLALSTSDNVFEAASAAAAAQRLIDKHQLDVALADSRDDDARDDADPIIDGREAPLERVKRPRRFRAALAHGLAGLYGGVAWTLQHDDGTESLCVVCRRSELPLIEALWSALSARIEWLSASGAGDRRRSRQWHDGFRLGAVDTIVDRLRHERSSAATAADGDDSANTSAGAIALRSRRRHTAEAVAAYVERHMSTGSGRSMLVDRAGYRAGRVAAEAMPLPPRSS